MGRNKKVLAGAAIVVAALGYQGWEWFHSPDQRCGRLVDAAAALERGGDREGAVAAYESALEECADTADLDVLDRAAEPLARIYAAPRPAPATPADADRAWRVVRRYQELPRRAQTAGDFLGTELLVWADALTGDEPNRSLATIRIYGAAGAVASPRVQATVEQRERALRLRLGQDLAATWPLIALDMFLRAGDEGLARSADLVAKIAEHPALLRAAAPRIEDWLDATASHNSAPSALIQKVRTALTSARAAAGTDSWAALLNGEERAPLEAHLSGSPRDQEIAIALAHLVRGSGDTAAALALMNEQGDRGWLVPEAQRLVADLLVDTGKPDEADRLLAMVVDLRLEGLERARFLLEQASDREERRLWQLAERDQLPGDVEASLEGKSSEQSSRLVGEWVDEQAAKSPDVARASERYDTYADVVPAAVALGTVRLMRASEMTGPERERMLRSAEEAFLRVRDDAEGSTDYHLGLAQVMYRLGRARDGEAEFRKLLSGADPSVEMSVAHAYRELGLESRAAETFEKVVERGIQPQAYQAAGERAILAQGNDETERWLRRADPQDPFIAVSLVEVGARRLSESGDYKGADIEWAKAIAIHAKSDPSQPSGANNAGVASAARFHLSGDIRHLRKGCEFFERAIRAGGAEVVVANAADTYHELSEAELLDRWMTLPTLRASQRELTYLVEIMLDGPRREEMVRALRASRSLRRAIALTRQSMALSPANAAPVVRLQNVYERLGDTARLAAMNESLARVKREFDQGVASSAGDDEDDAQDSPDSYEQRRLGELRAARQAAREKGERPTEAAALLLESFLLGERSEADLAVEDAIAAAAAVRAALRVWPDIGGPQELAHALVRVAALRARTHSPALAKSLEELPGRQLVPLLFSLWRTQQGATLLRPLLGEPEMREAMALLERSKLPRPKLFVWMLGRIAGSSQVERAGVGYFEDLTRKNYMALQCSLWPESPDDRMICQLWAAPPTQAR